MVFYIIKLNNIQGDGDMAFCHKCGSEVKESDNFCVYCGSNLHVIRQQISVTTSKTNEEKSPEDTKDSEE